MIKSVRADLDKIMITYEFDRLQSDWLLTAIIYLMNDKSFEKHNKELSVIKDILMQGDEKAVNLKEKIETERYIGG